jgi:hypothetical protein
MELVPKHLMPIAYCSLQYVPLKIKKAAGATVSSPNPNPEFQNHERLTKAKTENGSRTQTFGEYNNTTLVQLKSRDWYFCFSLDSFFTSISSLLLQNAHRVMLYVG